jgi:hypothetical protein
MFGHLAVQVLHPVDEFVEAERAVMILVHRGEKGLQIGEPRRLLAGRLGALPGGQGPNRRLCPAG